ncbi:DUF1343 domain-containing protein [Heliobacterium undosum]|uniref:DUF1343 domain-containing protein n=1 Tax=Heliomicrobium undosum TaxID=121734 RepID=A0A845L5B1_9FIRM|nr:exo-beta-N-acetylmuramidase NamZ domain-containing protein [Heliomicrobium undosum]MZP30409.1 DUF1343 domain-containing protein [Heliomicrobium undosum]
MQKRWLLFCAILLGLSAILISPLPPFPVVPPAEAAAVTLGNERLMSTYHSLIAGKRVGLVTNQTGLNSRGERTLEVLARDQSTKLVALFGPEHGVDGIAKAGEHVASYQHPTLNIPVYSLYGPTRMPTEEMLRNLDVLLFDIQDIGARSYTYMSTLNYCMVAAQKYNKAIIVLDRPNPVGGVIADGPVLEDPYKTFVGVDNLPMSHGMTAGELALYFNRNIGAKLTVVPMAGWHRNMVFQDTGLPWVNTSPAIVDLDAAFGYMATGLGEGTGVFQSNFKWIGAKGIDADKYAELLNGAGLPGVTFVADRRGTAGGVRLQITDYHAFNPAKTGIYALAYAHSLNRFPVPKSGDKVVMFDKIMGTDKVGIWLEAGLSPQEMEDNYRPALEAFREERKRYLIYGDRLDSPPGLIEPIRVVVDGREVPFDSAPYLDRNDRVMVPLRAIVEALGASVTWNGATGTITVEKAGNRSLFTVGSPSAVIQGEKKRLDAAPVILGARTMIPARYVTEAVGGAVEWDGARRTVIVRAKP